MEHPSIPADLGRVVVRYLIPDDWPSYIALERDAQVRRYVNGPSEKSDEQFHAGLRDYRPTTSLLVIADVSSNAFVGRCGLLPLRGTDDAELFILLASSSHRRGIGQLVLTFLVALAKSIGKRPVGIVHPENAASRALLERVGMVLEGTVSSGGYQAGHLRYGERGA